MLPTTADGQIQGGRKHPDRKAVDHVRALLLSCVWQSLEVPGASRRPPLQTCSSYVKSVRVLDVSVLGPGALLLSGQDPGTQPNLLPGQATACSPAGFCPPRRQPNRTQTPRIHPRAPPHPPKEAPDTVPWAPSPVSLDAYSSPSKTRTRGPVFLLVKRGHKVGG